MAQCDAARQTRALGEELKEFQMVKHLPSAAQVREAHRLCSKVKTVKRGEEKKSLMSLFELEAAPSGQWSFAVRSCPWFQLVGEVGWWLLGQRCTNAIWPTAAVLVCDLALQAFYCASNGRSS